MKFQPQQWLTTSRHVLPTYVANKSMCNFPIIRNSRLTQTIQGQHPSQAYKEHCRYVEDGVSNKWSLPKKGFIENSVHNFLKKNLLLDVRLNLVYEDFGLTHQSCQLFFTVHVQMFVSQNVK